jgi:predicted AlkP superfamily pyrophosphatase or phosphodiesterase
MHAFLLKPAPAATTAGRPVMYDGASARAGLRRTARSILRAAGVLLLLGASACGRSSTPDVPVASLDGEGTAPYLLLVSFDGFRHDYLSRGLTPAFDRLAAAGGQAASLVPAFPSKTFTNHYTIATGLYADRHGIVSNRFYDPDRREWYRRSDQTGVGDASWYGGEPIWVTAARQGVRAATMFWVGSEAPIGGSHPPDWHEFTPEFTESARVDSVLAWLGRPSAERPRLITLYFNSVDDAGHRHGPDSPEVNAAIAGADALLARLMDGVAQSPLADSLNIVVVSDHGMTEFREWIYLDDHIDLEGTISMMTEPTASLWFEGDSARMEQVHAALSGSLRNARVLRRSELPAEWRVKSNPRIGDLLVLPDEHFRVGLRAHGAAIVAGLHGYEALPSMHGILLAAGPGIAKGGRVGAVESVHVYPLLARLLGIRAAADIDGRLEPLAPLLRAAGPTPVTQLERDE